MITLAQMKTLLEGVTGFSKKVTYYEWPINEAPALPFVCYFSTNDYTFPADNTVYYQRPRISVELYTKNRDLTTEALFETAFKNAGLYYTKETEYLEDERCQMTVFSF